MKLKLAKDLSLPRDVITQKLAWMGRTGSGKTYGFSVLAEQMLDAGMQVVILDPVGVHWGLRLAANGKDPGIKTIYVFGGLHKDIPIEPSSGKFIADYIADKHISAVLDVSQFESDTDKARFANDWASRFFFRQKTKPFPVHIALEECQEFVPQNAMKGEEHMLHAFIRMWKLGRNFGIGGSLISQRPQEVNKKALNQSECFFAFQTTGPHERKAIEEWMKDKGIEQDIAGDLPKLKVGCAHAWSPAWLNISREIKIEKRRTYNASATPEFGAKPVEMKPLEPLEIEKLSNELKASIERAKQQDPDLLKRRIQELERQTKTARPKVDESAVSRAIEQGKAQATKDYAGRIRVLEGAIAKQQGMMRRAAEMLVGAAVKVPDFVPAPVAVPISRAAAPQRTVQVEERPERDTESMGERDTRILDTIATLDSRGIDVTVVTVARWMGIHPNGGRYRGNLKRLQEEGFLDGMKLSGGYATARAGTPGLDGVMAVLTDARRRILTEISEAGPLTIEELAAHLGVHPNGGRFRGNFNWLREMGVVTKSGPIELTEGARR